MRAPNSGIVLTEADAAVIKGMIARGDRQHDIAAWFGVNGGRIGEVSTGANFSDVAPQFDGLPPPEPYMSGRAAAEAKAQLEAARGTLSAVITEIDGMISRL